MLINYVLAVEMLTNYWYNTQACTLYQLCEMTACVIVIHQCVVNG